MAINLDVHGNTQPLEAAVQAAVNRIRRTPIKVTVDDKGATQPLGNMKRGADEFSKSMEAANARIIAFGASMAIMNGVANSFKAVVANAIEVEKALADINVVMGLTASNLDKFSDGLFKVAKETGAAFNVAAQAATEYARQGLSVEESLKRTRDALILTRLTGMDSAQGVKALTAAMNTYGKEIRDTTQLVSKFAAVDVKFAVSAEDFADAIARTGQAAKSAGVSIDELIGLVTAAQQQTARGGKVIGNSFKTIFTRIGRTDTLNQLENLGIAVRDLEGNTLGARRILTDLANSFDSLSEAQKAQIAQTVGGVFQINVLKAVLSDAAKQNGILANATQISAGATDEAIQKNEQLRQTMAAMATETGLALKDVSARVGEIMLGPGIEKILNVVKSIADGANNLLGDGESAGGKFANGFLKGLGNVITGPGLVVITVVFGKLFLKAAQFAKESLVSLIGVTSEAQKQKAIQSSLVALFGRSASLSKEMLSTETSKAQKEQIILNLLKAQVAEAQMLDSVAKRAASTLYKQGYNASLAPRRGRASGYIPNFAHPERQEAAQGGYAAGNIRSMNMPGGGSVIYNSAEKVKNFAGFTQPAIMPPLSSKAGKNYQQAFGDVHGFDPYAGSGFVPNFAVRAGQKVSKAGKTPASTIKNIGLKSLNPNNKLAILFGYGPEGVQTNSYSQKFQSMGPQTYREDTGNNASANSRLTRYLSRKEPNLIKPFRNAATSRDPLGPLKALHRSIYGANPDVSVSLPSKAIVPVTSGEVLSAKKMDERGSEKLKDIVEAPMNIAMKDIAKGVGHVFLPAGRNIDDKIANIFTKNSEGTKANDIIGALVEMGVRGALSAVAEEAGSGEGGKHGAAFDFTGGHAKKISEFFGKAGKSKYVFDAVEMKLRGSSAVGPDGGIAKKVINRQLSNQAHGYIPNFADPLSDAIGREKGAGVPVSQIRVGTHQALIGKGNPLGIGVTNTTDEPNGLRDVFGANGYVPNYAFKEWMAGVTQGFRADQNTRDGYLEEREKAAAQLRKNTAREKELEASVRRNKNMLDKSIMSKSAQNILVKRGNDLEQQLNKAKDRRIKAEQRAAAVAGQARGAAARGKFSGMGTMAMIGLPMAAGFLQQAGGGMGAQGGNQAMYAAGGALTGAASGAMMASMIAPFAGPMAPLVVGLGAVAGGVHGLISANEENTKALKEKTAEEAKAKKEKDISQGSAFGRSVVGDLTSKLSAARGASLNNLLEPFLGRSTTLNSLSYASGYGDEKGEKVTIDELLGRGSAADKLQKIVDLSTGAKTRSELKNQQMLESAAPMTKDQLKKINSVLIAEINRERQAGEDDKLQSQSRNEDKFIDDRTKETIRKLEEVRSFARSTAPDENREGYSRRRTTQEVEAKLVEMGIKIFGKDMNFKQARMLLSGGTESMLSHNTEVDKELGKNLLRETLAEVVKVLNVPNADGTERVFDIGGEKMNARQISEKMESDDFVSSAMKDMIQEVKSSEAALQQQTDGIIRQINVQKQLNEIRHSQALADLDAANAAAKFSKSLDDLSSFLGGSATASFKLFIKQEKERADLNKTIAKKQGQVDTNFKLGMVNSLTTNATVRQGFKNLFGDFNLNTKDKKGNEIPISKREEIQAGKAQLEAAFKDVNKGANEEQVNSFMDNFFSQATTSETGDVSFAKAFANLDVDVMKKFLENMKEADSGFKATIEDLIDKKKKGEELTQREVNHLREMFNLNSEFKKTQAQVNDIMKERAMINNSSLEVERKRIDMLQKQIQLEKLRRDVGQGPGYVRKSQRLQNALDDIDSGIEPARRTEKANMSKTRQDFTGKLAEKNLQLAAAVRVQNNAKSGSRREEQAAAQAALLRQEITGMANVMAQEEDNHQKRLKNIDEEAKLKKQKLREGFANEQSFTGGFSSGMDQMRDDTDEITHKLGKQMPMMLRDGLAEAMGAAINGAEDLGDVLRGVAMGFLQAIQQAMLQKAAGHVVDMVGGAMGFSGGGRVPAMVTNGEYIMGRDAVKKYGGGFMHSLNARGRIPSYSTGGPHKESAIGMNFGGSEGYATGRRYQSQKMSGFFYSGAAGNVGLQEDAQYTQGIIRERMRKAAEKKAKKRALMQMLVGTALSVGISAGLGNVAKGKGLFGESGSEVAMDGGGDVLNTADLRYMNMSQSQAADLGLKTTFLSKVASFLGFGANRTGDTFAQGGFVSGKSGIDQIPAMLSEGEYVIKASSARRLGPQTLNAINAGKFNEGGSVTPLIEKTESGISGGNTNNINISINVDKSGSKGEKSDRESKNPDEQSADQQKERALADRVKEQVVAVIIDEQRPGGLLSD